LDCTLATTSTKLELVLTAGSDPSPTANYVYILQTDPYTVTNSTTAWPATEHIKISYFLVQSAATIAAKAGSYVNQNWNDHTMGTDNMGHMLHVAERSRRDGAYWFSGVDANGSSDYLTLNGTRVDLASTSGVIYQMHKHTFPAFSTTTGSIVLVKNWSGDAYHDITNLYDIVDDSTGTTLSNRWFNFVVWGVANKTGEYEPMLINLPSGSYATQANAEGDVDGYDDFTMPREFNLESSTGFLIARITVRVGVGSWTYGSFVDLRGQSPTTASGGASGTTTNFADNQFTVFDEVDVTKVLAFDVGTLVAAGSTSTIQIPDADGIMALTDLAQTWTADQTIDDNIDLIFGAGDDGRIYSDGSNLRLQVTSDTAAYLQFDTYELSGFTLPTITFAGDIAGFGIFDRALYIQNIAASGAAFDPTIVLSADDYPTTNEGAEIFFDKSENDLSLGFISTATAGEIILGANTTIVDINASTGLELDGANLNSNWLVNTSNEIQFRASSSKIHSSAASTLDLSSLIINLNGVILNLGDGSSTVIGFLFNTVSGSKSLVFNDASDSFVFNDTLKLTGLRKAIVKKTGAYTVDTEDDLVYCEGTFTVTLPQIVDATNGGKMYHIKNSGTGVITVAADAADLIDDEATQTLYENDGMTIIAGVAANDNWHIV
jgi:hypothetical protein